MDPSHHSFTMPKKGEIFINQIRDRCQDLISHGIWDGLTNARLSVWLQNFTTPLEEYFAACVLDALIYRSDKQTIALMKQLFQRVLPDLTRIEPPYCDPKVNWYERLKDQWNEPNIRIVPVIREFDPPTKSGPLIARFYRRHLHINHNWMIWPWKINDAISSGVNIFLFIDDFLGTGDQFKKFVEFFSLEDIIKKYYVVYAPLVSHKIGLENLRSSLPSLKIAPVETLDEKYSLFARESLWFNDEINNPKSAENFYYELIKIKGLPSPGCDWRGYGKLALAYCFQHATPDNCLPILWHKTKTWEPLFER